MKSGKQRSIELKAKKQSRQQKQTEQRRAAREAAREADKLAEMEYRGGVAVARTALAANNSYDEPDFVKRGYYLNKPFTCKGCSSQEIWTAQQQKWWYEVAKGGLFTTAIFCRICRKQEQSRRCEARRIHLEGIAKKHQKPL